MSDQGLTGGSGDARPGRCDRHHDSGRTTKKRAGSVHELSCQAQDCAGDERGNWSRIPRNELMWRAGEGPLPACRSQAVWRLLELATMSAIWGDSENIY